MGQAAATIMPTLFMEPFGGVCVESQMCGTPVIGPNYAAFSETIQHGVTGYRCHTLEQFAWAAKNASKLDRARIHRMALENYSCDRVGVMFEEWFTMLYGLWGFGWPDLSNKRVDLDWLRKSY
jgi:glycosyltransferase involved in cell wall biosynthesis